MSGVLAVAPVVLCSYLRHAARVIDATVIDGDGQDLVAVVRRGRWSIWLRLVDDHLVGTLVHATWGADDEDLLFRSPIPVDVLGVGSWAQRHAANVVQRLEATPVRGNPMPQPLRLLVVDDESIARWSIRRLLDGHEVQEAANAIQARAWLDQEVFDGVLLDVAMPGESGTELLAWLHEHHPSAAARVCLMTADPSLIRDRSTPLLTKPFNRHELESVLAWFRSVCVEDFEDPATPPTLCLLCGRGHPADTPCVER